MLFYLFNLSPFQVSLLNTKSTVIVTASADIESASDFVAGCFQSEDLNLIRCVLVQASTEEKFTNLLEAKLNIMNIKSLDEPTLSKLKNQLNEFRKKGLRLIETSNNYPGLKAAIIKCPRSLITSDDLPIVNLEIFRTIKEGISFAKTSVSVGLWCDNVSTSFEYINSLPNAQQIWLNSAHGTIHPKIPFYNGKIICGDPDVKAKCAGDSSGSIVAVADNVQFITTFRANTFQTVVIPFGESFAN